MGVTGMLFSKYGENMFLTNVEEAVYYYGNWAGLMSSFTPKFGKNTP
jgi:hypothetical protein